MAGQGWRRIGMAVLLLTAAAEFMVRGPVRFVRRGLDWNDFLSPYIQAKTWLHGRNPYDIHDLVLMWPPDNRRPSFVDRDAATGDLQKNRGIPTPYPPTTFVVLSPFTQLNWSRAEICWVSINVTAVVFSLLGLLSMCGFSWHDTRGQMFLALGFALAPVHTGLATGNPAILAVGLCVAAFWSAEADWGKTSGILLALAVCLKPPLGMCLLLYYLTRRRWTVALTALTAIAIIVCLGLLRMELAAVRWFPQYLENTRHIFVSGSLADFTQASPVRFNMIDLQVLAYALFGSRSTARVLSLACGAALLAAWLWMMVNNRTKSGLLEVSTVFVLSLLPLYHRFYDATLLIWPLCWSLLVAEKRSIRVLTILPILPFLVPGAALLDELAQRGWVPTSIVNQWWWNTLVMPHEVWSLLLLGLLLLYFMSRNIRSTQDWTLATPASEAVTPVRDFRSRPVVDRLCDRWIWATKRSG